MNSTPSDIHLDIPDDLNQWLEAESIRTKQTMSELIVEIIETKRLFTEKVHAT